MDTFELYDEALKLRNELERRVHNNRYSAEYHRRVRKLLPKAQERLDKRRELWRSAGKPPAKWMIPQLQKMVELKEAAR